MIEVGGKVRYLAFFVQDDFSTLGRKKFSSIESSSRAVSDSFLFFFPSTKENINTFLD